nr:DUF5301 domain-containing protein [uncultured Ruminococcus sp.]
MMKKAISLILAMMMAVSVTMIGASAQVSADMPAETVNSSGTFDKKNAALAATGVTLDDPMLVPRVVVTTENGNGTSLRKSDDYVSAQISITDMDGAVLSDSCSFKVHGNTTAFDPIPKKAFTFKFAKKKDVLGMGKGKKWFLIANAYDPTLLRNYMAIDFAREMGLEYTSEQKFVELWLDGSYRGCYTLYEPVQEGKDRVNIDIETNDGKKDFLIEYEQLANEEDKKYFTVDGIRFAVKEPDDTTDDQLAYVSGVMSDIVEVLKSGKREDAQSVIDIPSFAEYYLLNEYMKNMDFDMSSVYFYYKDGKLYAGPAWDFDKSSGNTNPNIGSVRATNTYKSDGIIQDQRTLYKYIGRQPWFVQEVKSVYEEHYDYIEAIFADGGLLDSLREEYGELFARNFTVYNIQYACSNYQLPPLPTYEENYSYLKNWLNERNSWLREHYDLFSYEYLRGDADGDGIVDMLDVTTLQRALVNIKVDDDGHMALRAAMNGESIEITDATILQRYFAAIDVPFELNVKVKTYLR